MCCLHCSGFDGAAFDFVMVDVIFEACLRALCVCLCICTCVCVTLHGEEKTINRAEILDADQEYTTVYALVRNTCRGRHH